ncbi:MAG: sulfite exporter TauE/SafE family protein [Alcanivoracaceae bacterium]|mgnify:CR=1 FL=1|jgi:hypothetical protein|nr:sulfite exporter TauE/SafE family protein [Alcanivoracaceae bacterium]
MLLLAVGIGLLVGLVLGLTGAGGSVLAVPLLVYLLGLPMADAAGLSLGMVALAALVATASRLLSASGRAAVAWMPALVLVAGGALLVPAGQQLGRWLPDTFLLLAFALLTLVVAWRMWRLASTDPASSQFVRAGVAAEASVAPACELSESGQFEMRLPCLVRMLLAGALVGVLSGLFGVGGGFVIVPALVLLTGLPMAQAVATSLVVIALVATTGFAGYALAGLTAGQATPELVASLASGAVLGMGGGILLARYLAGPMLQKLFAALLVVVAAAVTLMEVMA